MSFCGSQTVTFSGIKNVEVVNISHLLGGFSSVKELRYCYVYPLRQNHDPAHYCSVVPVSAFPPFLD